MAERESENVDGHCYKSQTLPHSTKWNRKVSVHQQRKEHAATSSRIRSEEAK